MGITLEDSFETLYCENGPIVPRRNLGKTEMEEEGLRREGQ